MSNARRQGIFWLLTIPVADWSPPIVLPDDMQWIRGQAEEGGQTGYRHWQVLVAWKKKASIRKCQSVFGSRGHYELARSQAAADYVWKEDTRIEGTQFEHGHRPICRNSKPDWDLIWTAAKSGDMEAIPANLRVCHYRTLKQIAADYQPVPSVERQCSVFFGRTGSGKSRRAWEEAGSNVYCKDPRSKFWCGYNGEQHIVVDEFRGGIDVSHVLRWLDRYPCRVEVKGGSRPLLATKFWFTSNIPPSRWWPELDQETMDAVLRRMTVEEFI